MHMAKGLDTGDMIIQRSTPIEHTDTTGSIHDRLSQIGSDLIRDILGALLDGTAPRQEQNHALATYAPTISRADEQIDWSKTSQQIDCQIRGLNPWPVAFTTWNGSVVKVWVASVESTSSNNQQRSGSILTIDAQGIVIQCGQGSLRIRKLQPSGKNIMDAADFARGNRLNVGDRFGLVGELA